MFIALYRVCPPRLQTILTASHNFKHFPDLKKIYIFTRILWFFLSFQPFFIFHLSFFSFRCRRSIFFSHWKYHLRNVGNVGWRWMWWWFGGWSLRSRNTRKEFIELKVHLEEISWCSLGEIRLQTAVSDNAPHTEPMLER